MPSKIVLRDLEKSYPMGRTVVHALRGINLSLDYGKFYSLIGPSGSGKSTLMHILGAMDTPTSGEVWLEGRQIASFSERELTTLRAREIGFVFQAFYLNPVLTVLENVALTLRFLGRKKTDAEKCSRMWLERVGLGARLRHYPAELSGGERQRAAIARAIAKQPRLVLADEPTGNLDSTTGREIISLMREINRESGATILLVTHDRDVASNSDAIISIRDGQVLQ